MAQYDIIIVGGGVSGMTFAQKAAENGKNTLVLEAKPAAGGCLATMNYDGFWLELGGHTVYSSYAEYITDMKNAGMEPDFLPRTKAPFRMMTKRGLKSITSVMNFFELALNVPKMFFMNKKGRTVRQFYSSVLGAGNYQNMFRPMIQAVISQDGSDFPADLMLKSRPKDKSMPRSFTIRNGMNSYIQKIADMNGVTLKTSAKVNSVTKADNGYTVTDESGGEFSADRLVMACHPAMAAQLISGFAKEPAAELSKIKSASIESLGIVVNKKDITMEPFSFIIPQDDSYMSVVSRDVVPDERYRGFAFHFKPGKLSYSEKLDVVEKVLGISKVQFLKTQEALSLSPTLGMEHEELITRVDDLLPMTNGLYIVGNYFGGLAIEDCARRSEKEACRMLCDCK